MIVVVNEKRVEVDEQTTVAALLESLGFPDRGIAVALDLSVLPRSHWTTELSKLPGAPVRLEVVTAVQGG
jgi:sulfur carrier protein